MTTPAEGQPAPTRVVVRPLATPLPLGLYSFGLGMLMLAAEGAGWIPREQSRDVGLVIATFVFPLEGVAAIFAFLARDTLAATTLGLFSTSWVTVGVAMITGTPGEATATLGFYLAGFAVAVVTLAALAASGKPLLAVILACSATRAAIDAAYELSAGSGAQRAAGYVAAVIAVLAWYAGTAMLLEDLRPAEVLPVFRRGTSRTAIRGELAEQVADVGGEAGVRRPL